MTSVSGIYVILHKKSGKVYIGQAQDIPHRWREHKNALKGRYHKNRHLQAAWNKYGAKEFQFKVLEYCSVGQLDEREDHFLTIYMPKGICYNVAPHPGTTRGMYPNEESRRKMSEAGKRRPPKSEETRQKLRIAKTGNKIWLGKKHTEETKRKMSESAKGNTRALGAVRNAETRQKMSEWQKGKPKPSPSEETRTKLSDAHKGEKNHNFGKPLSDEAKRKLSEKALIREARKRAERSQQSNED